MMEKTSARKVTQAAGKVRGIVRGQILKAHAAKANGEPVAYCMMGSFYEPILFAMGIHPVWTEQYGALCAVKRKADQYLQRAEAEGYSNTICGYVRNGLGFDYYRSIGEIPEDAPDGGMPLPDLLLGSSQTCDPRYKWYQACGRYMQVPRYAHDVLDPPVHADLKAIEPYYVKYYLEQMNGLVEFLEHQTKRKLDLDKLDFAYERLQQVWKLWYDCDMLRKAIPGPMPSEDSFNVFVPAHCLCFDDLTLPFYQDLYDELRQRIADKLGVVEDERYRLMWAGGVPPWHSMWIFNYFEQQGAVFVMDQAYRRWDPVEDVPKTITHPLEKLAYLTFRRLTQWYEEAKAGSGYPLAEHIRELIHDFKIDGVVVHVTKSCRSASLGQLFMNHVIRQNINVPFLQLTSDLVDIRDFAEEQWKSSIDAFVETVASAKK